MNLLCPWEGAEYFGLYSSNVPPLLYYSHVPALIIAILWGGYMFFHAKKDIRIYSLLAIFLLFSAWNIFDLILWATNRPDITLFFWSLQVLFEVLVFMFAFYLTYTYQRDQDVSKKGKFLMGLAVVPFILVIPTSLNLIGVYQIDCIAIENLVANYYSYILEAIFVIAIAITTLESFRKNKDKQKRKEILLVGSGIFLFLMMFIYGNLIGSFLDDWRIAQFGLFGMPVFVTFLVYSIVRFRSFKMRMFGVQALVASLWILLAAVLFVQTIENVRIIVSLTLILFLIVGILLVRSVRREIEQREKIEKLAEDLRIANEGQTNLIHIINHQVKGYIAKGRNIFAELSADGYGKMPEESKPLLKEGLNSLTEAVAFVQQILNASNVERGTMTYTMKPFDFKKIVSEVTEKQKTTAEQKDLEFNLEIKEGDYTTNGDESQLKEAVRNLIDNSINYTPKGKVKVSLEKKGNNILLTVKDTGIGINEEDKKRLFTKGGRGKDSLRVNVNSTGYGLSFVKGVVMAHKGRVWAESDGPGKGSTFFMELPA